MKVKDVLILRKAVEDMNDGRAFYDHQEHGVGDYFWGCLISDIESLIIHAGIHQRKCGYYQMFSRRFPYAIYYEILNGIAYVVAVLPMRRDPTWIIRQLKKR